MKKRNKKDISEIVIHHSGFNFLNRFFTYLFHKYIRGWEDIGYHYMIGNGIFSKCGKIYEGRKIEFVGAHVKNYNEKTIGVCCIGNYDKKKMPKKQMESLINLLVKLSKEYNIKPENIKGHREYPGVEKTCPGLMIDMEEIREEVRKRLD